MKLFEGKHRVCVCVPGGDWGWLKLLGCGVVGSFYDMFNDESGESEAKDGGDVCQAAVDLGFVAEGFVGGAQIGEEFIAEYALEFARGKLLLFLNLRRRAAPRGQPFTCQNSATWMRVGSNLRAAPMEENTRADERVALSRRRALSWSESMASTT